MNKKRVAEPAVEETSAAELTQAQDTPQPDPTDAQPTPAPNPEPVEQPAEEEPVEQPVEEQPVEQPAEQPAEPVQAAAESDAPVAETSPVEAKPRKQRKSSAELKAASEEKRQAKSQAAAAKRKADQARKAAANRNKGKSSSKKTAKPTLAQKRADKKAARLAAKTEAANQKAQEAADKQAALQSQKAAAAAQKQAKAQQKADRKAQRRTKKKPLTAEERKQLKRDKKEALKQLAQQRKQILHNQLPPKPQPQQQPLPETEFFGKKLPYPGNFPVYCCKYVICRDASPSVALRFFNASDITVTGLRFTITQKDGDGNPIESVTMERLGLFAESSTEFAVADAPVSASCEEIDVCVNAVRSDDYEYIIDDSGQVTLSYGTNKLGKEFFFKEAPTYSVKKKRKGYTLLALGAVLGMVAVMLLVLMAMGVFS